MQINKQNEINKVKALKKKHLHKSMEKNKHYSNKQH